MPDILSYGQEVRGKEIDPMDYETIKSVAGKIKELGDQYNLKILILQPFANFEGWQQSRNRQNAFDRAVSWMGIMQAAGTDMLQVSQPLR